ncbi:hypothetical protein A374_04744 [Fictibacillus macauensis ZFHKF-1]|uniref:YpbS n=1 Tax=Fictibacillus macauensis ZFHKF-1 TaxID=1196324 RepID=I8UJ42_9BACL|nr:hypothetical protein A374_04744 [Fictibacillus macauensis ZFHKF-1]
MSVHQAISEHSKNQHQIVSQFVGLEQERERAIAEALHLCQNEQFFSVEDINKITKEMNALAQKGIVPARQYVTVEMVKDYANKVNSKK